jgi:hypothetical protein
VDEGRDMKHKEFISCDKCPFARFYGSYAPVERYCDCPGLVPSKKDCVEFVWSGVSGWWYKTAPDFCPIRKHGQIIFRFDGEKIVVETVRESE